MANITEVSEFTAAVPELDTVTPALGGPGGVMNSQAQALANRTKYIKDALDTQGVLTPEGRADANAIAATAGATLAARLQTAANVEDGADVTDETNVTAAAVGTAEVTAAPAHWWVLVAGALKRMTHAGWTALVLAATGKTNAATGFTLAGGTTSRTLTVSANADTANIPAAAPTATPTASRVPVADGSGKLDGWITGGAPTATQTASRIPLFNAAKGLNVDGISFPATQVPSADANTLDDYEEGTWTPTLFGSITTGSNTYSIQVGFYTKKGREVTLSGHLVLTKDAGMAGNVYIGGVPFVPTNTSNYRSVGSLSHNASAITATAPITIRVQEDGSRLYFRDGIGYLDSANLSASPTISFSITYIV